MFDRVFSAALVFGVLAGGTLAIATAMLEQNEAAAQVVQLPRVVIVGTRTASASTVAHVAQADAAQQQ